MMKCEWILCPVCGSKTRNKIRKDTVLKNYPLYCPKCRQERLINSALAKMLKRMKAAGYESYAEAAGAFLQESDYIPTQMETQNSIMKKRTGEVRLPSDHKMKK